MQKKSIQTKNKYQAINSSLMVIGDICYPFGSELGYIEYVAASGKSYININQSFIQTENKYQAITRSLTVIGDICYPFGTNLGYIE